MIYKTTRLDSRDLLGTSAGSVHLAVNNLINFSVSVAEKVYRVLPMYSGTKRVFDT